MSGNMVLLSCRLSIGLGFALDGHFIIVQTVSGPEVVPPNPQRQQAQNTSLD